MRGGGALGGGLLSGADGNVGRDRELGSWAMGREEKKQMSGALEWS